MAPLIHYTFEQNNNMCILQASMVIYDGAITALFKVYIKKHTEAILSRVVGYTGYLKSHTTCKSLVERGLLLDFGIKKCIICVGFLSFFPLLFFTIWHNEVDTTLFVRKCHSDDMLCTSREWRRSEKVTPFSLIYHTAVVLTYKIFTLFSFDNSTSTFTSALWFNAVLAIGFFGAFFILRTTRPQTYAPRTYAVAKE